MNTAVWCVYAMHMIPMMNLESPSPVSLEFPRHPDDIILLRKIENRAELTYSQYSCCCPLVGM